MDICTKCDGMKIVHTLNTMFGMFDYLSDKNEVYKVETVKDSFVGVSGAPEKVISQKNSVIQNRQGKHCVILFQYRHNVRNSSEINSLILEQKSR